MIEEQSLRSEEKIRQHIVEYYSAKLAQHGPTPAGVDWNGEESQALRHQQFLRLFGRDHEASILDLGCGYGAFLPFLRERGYAGRYTGYDVAPVMIEAARRLHGEGADRQWYLDETPKEAADYAVASGIFNVKGETRTEDWIGYIYKTIDELSHLGRRGFGFNVLSVSSDPARRRLNLYYANPVEMIDYCLKRFGRSVAFLQDYGLWEFTVLVHHHFSPGPLIGRQ